MTEANVTARSWTPEEVEDLRFRILWAEGVIANKERALAGDRAILADLQRRLGEAEQALATEAT